MELVKSQKVIPLEDVCCELQSANKCNSAISKINVCTFTKVTAFFSSLFSELIFLLSL
jgi:hypothetical protein